MSRWKDPKGAYIRMHSGRQFFLSDPEPSDFHLDDICYHMARINRYTGASTYTNGQHSIVAARMAARFYPDHALLPARMLIHDVAEHAYGDVSSPLKSLLPDYKALEAKADLAVEQRFDLTFVGDPLVKEVDDRMWLTERLTVYPMLSQEADYSGPLEPFPISVGELDALFRPWETEEVELEMRVAFAELLPWIRQ